MPGGVARWIPVVVLATAALPLAWLMVTALTRFYKNRGTADPRTRALAETGMVVGTVPWLWMILTPIPAPREVRLVPLVDLADQLSGSPLVAFFQVGGNLLVFSAFGWFAPMRWPIGPVAVLLVAAAGSATVEALQYALALGRVSSVDDVLLNAAGAGLAAAAATARSKIQNSWR